MALDLGDSVDGSVELGHGGWGFLRQVGAVTEEVVAAGAASVFGPREIRGVTIDMQDHAAGRIVDGRISIGRGVVEEPNDLVVGLLGGSIFLCAEMEPSSTSMVGSTEMA